MKGRFVWVVALLGGLLIGGTGMCLFGKHKIAYINTSVLLEKAVLIQSSKSKLKADIDKAKLNVDTLQGEFELEMKKYEKSVSSMSAREKGMAQELLNIKKQELMRYRQAMEEKLAQQDQKNTGEALKAINSYITEYGKKHGYKIIFATVNGNIAYADDGLDITEEIVKGVNNEVK